MKLKCKNGEQFRQLMTALFDDLVDAHFHRALHRKLVSASKEYATEFSQSPTFWGLTFTAHIDAALVHLCRAYDPYENGVLTLRNFLQTIEANLKLFEEPNFRERLKGNPFVDSLAAELKRPNQAQLNKDIAAVSNSDVLVGKLVTWRHNYVAHRNRNVAVNPQAFAAKYPLLFTEIDELISRGLTIANRYTLLFNASVQTTMMVGADDYLTILKAVREHVEAFEGRMDEEWKRLGVTRPARTKSAATD